MNLYISLDHHCTFISFSLSVQFVFGKSLSDCLICCIYCVTILLPMNRGLNALGRQMVQVKWDTISWFAWHVSCLHEKCKEVSDSKSVKSVSLSWVKIKLWNSQRANAAKSDSKNLSHVNFLLTKSLKILLRSKYKWA